MASATIECDVSNEKFDSGNHKPLCLTCGHTFCFSCIIRLCDVPETKNCPKCREPISQDADQLPVNFALIPTNKISLPSAVGSQSKALCPQHQKALDYLCVDCVESVCFPCSRGTHATHKIEMIDDLLQDNEDTDDVWAKIRPTLQNKLDSVSSVVTLSDSLSGFIDDIIKLKPDFDGWKDLLLAQKVSTEQDLQAWDASGTSLDVNMRLDCKEILSRLKLNFGENGKLPEIKALLDAAAKTSASLELQTCELMPIGKPWIISSSDEGERALASLASNRKPSRLVVLSTHTRPIPGLGELLSRLAARHSGKISLLPLDSFWRPAGQADGGMQNIVDNLRGKLTALYGCPSIAKSGTYVNLTNCNIRLDCPADVLHVAYYTRNTLSSTIRE
ncbi:E3 ubiquitin-protein ligase TRIM39-like [Hyalella azteca]|uniref:E3 ubiquitin-protein ligase TRIM39-like n=1 Tax=Hyalella azteca TaxID=294128 RepID=A0A8B7NN73_HYAAZ|nr:E3 ubiquitin-protein ligase TRIM39-like [Hyalella azteca]